MELTLDEETRGTPTVVRSGREGLTIVGVTVHDADIRFVSNSTEKNKLHVNIMTFTDSTDFLYGSVYDLTKEVLKITEALKEEKARAQMEITAENRRFLDLNSRHRQALTDISRYRDRIGELEKEVMRSKQKSISASSKLQKLEGGHKGRSRGGDDRDRPRDRAGRGGSGRSPNKRSRRADEEETSASGSSKAGDDASTAPVTGDDSDGEVVFDDDTSSCQMKD